jgi:hypothetical protein
MKTATTHNIGLTPRQQEIWLESERERTMNALRPTVAFCLLALFTVNTVSVLTMIFLVGLQKMVLSDTLMLTLIAETIAQSAAVFISVSRVIFPSRPRR